MNISIPTTMNELQPYLKDKITVDRTILIDEYDRLLRLRYELVSLFVLKKGKFFESKKQLDKMKMETHKHFKTNSPLRLGAQDEFKLFVAGSEPVREQQYATNLLETEMTFVENQTETLDGWIWFIKAEIGVKKFEAGGGII